MWSVVEIIKTGDDIIPFVDYCGLSRVEANRIFESYLAEMAKEGFEIKRRVDFRSIGKNADYYYKKVRGTECSVHIAED